MKTFWQLSRIGIGALIVFAAASLAFAQQPLPRNRTSPSLTTEDLVRSAPNQAPVESADTQKKTPADGPAVKPPTADGGNQKVSAEEEAWRGQVARARWQARETERVAEEGELRITDLRNRLAVSGQTPQAINNIAAELDEAGRLLIELRARARQAADELDQLLESGRRSRFTEAEGPSQKLDDGRPNNDFYTSRFAELSEELQTADRRVQLYENRVRDLSQRILQTGGRNGGDNFYLAQLQGERDEAQKQLDEAREVSLKAQRDLQALREDARRAGVPPGVFR